MMHMFHQTHELHVKMAPFCCIVVLLCMFMYVYHDDV